MPSAHAGPLRRGLLSFQTKKQVAKWKSEIKLQTGLNAPLTMLTERRTYQGLENESWTKSGQFPEVTRK